MSISELKAAGNGIWLCGRHAKLIDNNRGNSYPPETLLSYKALHEARVLLEHEGLYPPIGWLHELKIDEGPVFSSSQTIQLAKLNLIYGANGTGKTAIAEWIAGFFSPDSLTRWMSPYQQQLRLRMSLLNPKLQHLCMSLDKRSINYSVDGAFVAFIPIGFKLIKPARPDFSIDDDREMLAQALGFPVLTVEALIKEVNSFPHANVANLRFELDIDDDGNQLDRYVLLADVIGTVPGLPLRNLSGAECERILLELSTAAARLSGRYCPTLLVLDGSISMIFRNFFDYYSHHLLDPVNQFQTLMCIPDRYLDLDNVQWNGWQVIRTTGKPPNVVLNQEVRATRS